jgi:hypothetical protein
VRDQASRSGPVRLPAEHQGGFGLLAWAVAGVVLVAAIVFYVATHLYGPSPAAAPPPAWGRLTLARVAMDASRAAGEPHPQGAVWVSTVRSVAVRYLSGAADDSAEADYLVVLQGRFRASPPSLVLPGSLSRGTRLAVLVRGFDGRVTGLFVTDRRLADLRRLGIVHPLPLGLHL